MRDDKLYKRLESLFSGTEPVEPEPAQEAQPATAELEALRAQVAELEARLQAHTAKSEVGADVDAEDRVAAAFVGRSFEAPDAHLFALEEAGSAQATEPATRNALRRFSKLLLRYRTVPLRAKAAINLAVLILAVVIVGVAGTQGLNNLNFQVDNLYNFMLIPIDAIEKANLALSEAQEAYLEIASGRLSRQDVEATISQIRALDDEFQTTLSRYDTEWVTTVSEPFTQLLIRNGRLDLQTDEAATLSHVHSELDAYLALRDTALPRILSGEIDPLELQRFREASDSVESEMDHLIDINLQFAEVSYQDAVSSYQASTTAMAVTGVLVTVLGVGLLFVLLRGIILPLNALRRAAGQVAAGQMDVAARVFANDEIGLVTATFNKMTARLRNLIGSLEARVAARTRDLQLASEVSRNVSQVRDLDTLLANAVELIRLRFDLYYTQIYLTDPSGRMLVLRAGAGAVGAELLRRSHRLPIGPGSINGRAAEERRAVIVADTTTSGAFKPNPLLPNTRSEMAVPLTLGDHVVGVLDLQSDQPGTLSVEYLPAFEALAGQLAIAIQNAALFAETEQARAELEMQARSLTRSGWQEFLNAVDRSERLGYTYDQQELTPLTDRLLPASDAATLMAPITLLGEPIGTIQLEREAEAGQAWTLDETELVNLVAARVARQVENLRLLAQAEQFRAEAEAATRRLTREGWESYLESLAAPDTGYVYDLNQVSPLRVGEGPGERSALVQPLTVRDETIGELAIDGIERLDDEATELLAKVAERLSAHVENLRLAEQTQKRAVELEEATTFLDSVVENLPVMLFVKEAENLRFIRWNEAGEELVGFRRSDLIGKNDYDFFPKEEADFFIAKDREVLAGGQLIDIPEEPIQTAHKGTRILHTTKVPVLGADGKPKYLLGISEDITERKRAEEALAKRAVELETVAHVSAAASTILEADQLLQNVVDLTQSRFGLYHAHIYLLDKKDEETLILMAGAGEVGRQMVAEGRSIPLNQEQSLVARAARSRQGVIVNDVREAPDFLPNPLLPDTRAEMAVPLIVGDRLLGVFDVQSDRVNHFTEEDVRIQTTLAAQVAVALQNATLYAEQSATVIRLRELDHLKSSFLANMSHELRTPLNSILGFTDVMIEGLDGPLTEPMDNDLRLISRNGQHLLSLINDVLDMAKIESGKMNLNVERFNLHEVLSEVVDITNPLARDKSLVLCLDVGSSEELDLHADRIRLRQVMINLVGNAIKFTEKGGVTISAARDNGHIRISVRDTGAGIPPEQANMIFEEFSQADTSTTRRSSGTGLGLPISKRLVELHGGRLWVESAGVPGEGATFHIEFPVVSTYPRQPADSGAPATVEA